MGTGALVIFNKLKNAFNHIKSAINAKLYPNYLAVLHLQTNANCFRFMVNWCSVSPVNVYITCRNHNKSRNLKFNQSLKRTVRSRATSAQRGCRKSCNEKSDGPQEVPLLTTISPSIDFPQIVQITVGFSLISPNPYNSVEAGQYLLWLKRFLFFATASLVNIRFSFYL